MQLKSCPILNLRSDSGPNFSMQPAPAVYLAAYLSNVDASRPGLQLVDLPLGRSSTTCKICASIFGGLWPPLGSWSTRPTWLNVTTMLRAVWCFMPTCCAIFTVLNYLTFADQRQKPFYRDHAPCLLVLVPSNLTWLTNKQHKDVQKFLLKKNVLKSLKSMKFY